MNSRPGRPLFYRNMESTGGVVYLYGDAIFWSIQCFVKATKKREKLCERRLTEKTKIGEVFDMDYWRYTHRNDISELDKLDIQTVVYGCISIELAN